MPFNSFEQLSPGGPAKMLNGTQNPTTRVAVIQAEPKWLDLDGAISKTCSLIDEAAQNGAQLVAFPECWIPGYPAWIW